MGHIDETHWWEIVMAFQKHWLPVMTFDDHWYDDDVNGMALCQFWLSLVILMLTSILVTNDDQIYFPPTLMPVWRYIKGGIKYLQHNTCFSQCDVSNFQVTLP